MGARNKGALTGLSLLLSLLLLTISATQLVATEETQLPPIWQSAPTGSYHVLYQLEVSSLVLTIEEWASYNRRLFRLDLIGPEGRTSYLTNGETGESFRYQPFVCTHIGAEKTEDLATLAELFYGHQWDPADGGVSSTNTTTTKKEGQRPPVLAYGLGPLWLRAAQDAQSVVQSSLTALGNYDEYEVTMKPGLVEDQKDYKIRFHFAKGEPRQFVEFIDWVEAPKGDDGGGGGGRDETIQARARVIQADYRGSPVTLVDESVFDIPVGYGCPRLPDLDLALDIDVGLELLHQGAPNQATLEVITSRPQADDNNSNKPGGDSASLAGSWTSQRYSMRMMRLSKSRLDSVAKTESYYATLMQFRDSGSPSRLRRIKRVWWAPDSERGQATVYTMDLARGGACRVDHQDVRNQILLNFGGFSLSPLATSRGSAGPENEGAGAGAASGPPEDTEEEGEEVLAGPMVLSVSQIAFLFADNQDYHLIHLGETFGAEKRSRRFRNRVYEKRVRNFQLTGDGAISWRGPVSIVKQISTYSHLLDSAGGGGSELLDGPGLLSRAGKLSSDFRQRLTIFFYSEPDMSRLLYKAVVELLDNHEVSLEYAHQQLDVSSCFPPEAKQTVTLKYPLESAKLARELQQKRAALQSQVFVKLFTRLSSSFAALQVYALGASFDVFHMRLQMSLLDMPLTHTFQLERGLKLVAAPSKSNETAAAAAAGDSGQAGDGNAPWSLVHTTASSADACGDHCEHYNCLRFSYEAASRSCAVELVGSAVVASAQATTAPAPTGELYTYLERRETKALARERDVASPVGTDDGPAAGAPVPRAHLSADAIVEYLSELVDAAQVTPQAASSTQESRNNDDDDDERNPLVLKLDLAPDLVWVNDENAEKKARSLVTLRPSVLEHTLENMQEYEREFAAEEAGAAESQQVVRVTGRSLRLQFNILLADRVLANVVGQAAAAGADSAEELSGLTYEECERQCESQDCRAFSYCQRDETCRLSWQHQEKFLRAGSRPAPPAWQCNVYSLDYLSKFEPYGRVPAPLKATTSTEAATSARDCANACMDAQAFQCQGFYACRLRPAPGQPAASLLKCYLVDWHVNSMQEHERSRLLNPMDLVSGGASGPTLSGDSRECDFYSRSYLAQFDKYFARRLDLGQADALGVAVQTPAGLDLESCAKQCLKINCLGFDACPAHESGGGGGNLPADSRQSGTQCHLAVKSLRASQLKRAPHCTTFILSDKSHFNSQKLKLIPADQETSSSNNNGRFESLRPDREANIGRQRQSADVDLSPESGSNRTLAPTDVNARQLELLENYGKLEQDAHNNNGPLADGPPLASLGAVWLGKFCSLALGATLGFGAILGWNEAYARGWLDRARWLR